MKQYKYVILLFLILANYTVGYGQGIKTVDFTFKVDNNTYKGSFSYTFKFSANLKEKQKLQPGNYYFDISETPVQKIFYLEINGKSITWDRLLPSEIKDKLELVIQKEWVIRDKNGVLKPQNFHSNCISSRETHQIPYFYKKDGKGKSRIGFAVKLPKSNCQDLVIKDHFFEFQYQVTSQKNAVEEPVSNPTKVTEPNVSTVTDEDIKWNECATQNFQLPCLTEYIQTYPSGKYILDAKARTDSHLWKEAVSRNSIQAYRNYNNNSTNTDNIAEANKRIKELSDKFKESEKKIDPIKQEWTTTKKRHTIAAYQAFFKKYPKSKYAEDASKYSNEIQIIFEDQGKGVYKLNLNNVFRPVIDSVTMASGIKIDQSNLNKKKGFELVATILDGLPHTIFFSDKTKPEEFSRNQFSIDNLLNASMEEKGDSLFFTFSKGTPPYSVFFKRKGLFILKKDAKDNSLAFSKEEIRAKLSSTETISVEAWDGLGNAGVNLKTIEVEIEEFPWQYPAAAIGGLLFIFILRSIFKNRKKKKFTELNEKRKIQEGIKTVTEKVEEPSIPEVENKDPILEEATTVEEVETPAAKPTKHESLLTGLDEEGTLDTNDEKLSGLKIKKFRKAQASTESVETNTKKSQETSNSDYYYLQQKNHWNDSIISEIGFSKKSIYHLDKFLRDQNAQATNEQGQLMEEVDGSIPEIGGLLMGHSKHFKDTDTYVVTVEEFIPINPEFNNVYRLEFSTQSLAKELGDAQDQFANLALVGWFHTHPGHGLFLSKSDLTIHEGFFREPYQFAMEIDSRTENFDTGFFTRQKDGQVNNIENKKLNTPWFAWTEVEKFMRKKN